MSAPVSAATAGGEDVREITMQASMGCKETIFSLGDFRFRLTFFYDSGSYRLLETRFKPLNPDRKSAEYAAVLTTIAASETMMNVWSDIRSQLPPHIPEPRKISFKQPEPPKGDHAGYVYLVQSVTGAYKIGRTRNPRDRMRTFGVLLPFEVEYLCLITTTRMIDLERELHRRFADKRLQGEWFALGADDIEYIKGLAT